MQLHQYETSQATRTDPFDDWEAVHAELLQQEEALLQAVMRYARGEISLGELQAVHKILPALRELADTVLQQAVGVRWKAR